VIRLVGFLVMLVITAGGYLYLDYRMASRWASAEGADGLTVGEYLSGLTGRMAGLGGANAASGMPTGLAEMLPKAPEGWTVRATLAEDAKGFLPKSEKKADKKALSYVRETAKADQGKGLDSVALTYEKADRKVIVKAVRYPNIIFTGLMAMQQRFELQMRAVEFHGTEFMTVRGLDVTEDLLPDGFRGRLFIADVGAQIHLRILAPKRMTDKELVPFFETLHVRAMNASVIDKQEGLGEVPVIVLASALDEAARDAYVASLAEREAETARKDQAAQAEAEAQAQAAAVAGSDAKDGGGLLDGFFGGGEEAAPAEEATPAASKTECKKSKDGVKRCKVSSGTADE
jgi:hypothetical protein